MIGVNIQFVALLPPNQCQYSVCGFITTKSVSIFSLWLYYHQISVNIQFVALLPPNQCQYSVCGFIATKSVSIFSLWLYCHQISVNSHSVLYFHLVTSKLIYFQLEARCSKELE